MRHLYYKNGAEPVPDIFWVLVPLGYAAPKKKKSFSFIFSFEYITKIDKSSGGGENMFFSCNYVDVYFFSLLFWILVFSLKTIKCQWMYFLSIITLKFTYV